jgi:hypothetical protein
MAAANARLQKVVVNGQQLVDGVNSSYGANGFHLDFADPNDLGHDSSGNGNDFTATGFDTAPVGIFSPDLYCLNISQSTPPFDTTEKQFNPATPATNMFNGVNPSASPNYAAGSNPGTWLVWRPNTPITVNSTIELETPWQNDQYWINEVLVTAANQSPLINWSGELTNLAIRGLSSTAGACGIVKIDGVVLIDNTGTDYDLMQDSPTQNYALLNPLNAFTPNTLYDANLKSSNPVWGSAGNVFVNRTFDDDEQYYFEINIGARGTSSNQKAYPHLYWVSIDGTNSHSALANETTNNYFPDGKPDWDAGDTLRIRTVSRTQFDLSKNGGDWVRVVYPMDNAYLFGITNSDNSIAYWNFGQQPLLYEVPGGWTTLQTQNLPAAPIADGRDHFQALTGPGQGADASIPDALLGDFASNCFYSPPGATVDFGTTAAFTAVATQDQTGLTVT